MFPVQFTCERPPRLLWPFVSGWRPRFLASAGLSLGVSPACARRLSPGALREGTFRLERGFGGGFLRGNAKKTCFSAYFRRKNLVVPKNSRNFAPPFRGRALQSKGFRPRINNNKFNSKKVRQKFGGLEKSS